MATKKRTSRRPKRSAAEQSYITYARHNIQVDGEIEFDDDAKVSMSQDGAYVQAWVYVPAWKIEG